MSKFILRVVDNEGVPHEYTNDNLDFDMKRDEYEIDIAINVVMSQINNQEDFDNTCIGLKSKILIVVLDGLNSKKDLANTKQDLAITAVAMMMMMASFKVVPASNVEDGLSGFWVEMEVHGENQFVNMLLEVNNIAQYLPDRIGEYKGINKTNITIDNSIHGILETSEMTLDKARSLMVEMVAPNPLVLNPLNFSEKDINAISFEGVYNIVIDTLSKQPASMRKYFEAFEPKIVCDIIVTNPTFAEMIFTINEEIFKRKLKEKNLLFMFRTTDNDDELAIGVLLV